MKKDEQDVHDKEAQPSKCDFLFKYQNMVKVDLMITVLHLLAIFVLYNIYMFITIGLVRLPRLLFGLIQLCLRKDVKHRQKALSALSAEFKIRIVTTVIMFIASLIINFVYINKQFCV